MIGEVRTDMKSFQVVTDSTCDLEEDLRIEYEIDYVMMDFSINGNEYKADLDWKNLSSKEYYDLMRKGYRASTGMVNSTSYYETFEKYLMQGLDVLYIACSSKLSGSLNSAKIIASELIDKYPNNRVICMDSLRSCMAQGLISIEACRYANEGCKLNDAVKKINHEILNYQTYATVDSLEWLRKSGRVKASTAFFGNLLGIKPIIVSDANGDNYAYKKVRGRKQSLDALSKIIDERLKINKDAVVYIEHADCIEDANYVMKKIKMKNSDIKVRISSVGPIIGATVGPNSIIVNFYGEKVLKQYN